MKVAKLFLFFSSISGIFAQMTFPAEPCVLNDPCKSDDGSDGVFKLSDDCESKVVRVRAFISSAGAAAVCCPKITRSKSKEYCSNQVTGAPYALTFNIYEGDRAEIGEFPHMAAVGFEDSIGRIEYDCGGSIISENFVITAAHCCNIVLRQPKVVRLGRTSLNLTDTTDGSAVQDIKVKRVIIPDEYTSRQYYNDIALLELENAVIFSDTVKPICLHSDDNENENGKSFTVTGYGRTENGTKSEWLIKADVNGILNSDCRETYGNSNVPRLQEGIKESQICAVGERKLGRQYAMDACEGDSGGPLQIKNDLERKFYLFGITSFGLGCGGTFPSVYTKVSSRIKWIEDRVWPN